MKKVLVIDIDLGVNVDDLIAKCSKDLTKEAREQLDGALAAHIEAKQMKEEKATAKKKVSDGVSTVLQQVYNTLEAAGHKGVLSQNIISSVEEYIATASAFTIRMNKHLAKLGNPYRLVRIKREGEFYYVFEDFNEQTPKISES